MVSYLGVTDKVMPPDSKVQRVLLPISGQINTW